MDPIGRSPIPVPFFALGKLSFLVSWLFPLARVFDVPVWYDGPATRLVGVILACTALLLVVFAFIHLGRSVSLGLPDAPTELKTHGVYRFSRNPMYMAGFILCIGSCLFVVHAVNILSCVTAIVIHSWIVRKEEAYLEKKFGRQWLDYKATVPRFAGWPKGWRNR